MCEGLTNPQAALFAAVKSFEERPHVSEEVIKRRAKAFLGWLNDADERDGI